MTRKSLFQSAALAAILVAAGVQHPSAYVAYGYKWHTLQVPFYVNPQNLDVSPSAALAAVQFGAYAWTNQSNTSFAFQYAGSTTSTTVANNGRNEVFFRNGSKDSAIATAYTWSSGSRMLEADIVFWDASYQFFTGDSGCSSGFYIEDVAAHEFGHALGLGHSSVSDATMVSGQRYCSIDKRWLAEDDKLGVEYLYPPGGTRNTEPTVKISSPSDGSSFVEGTSISFSGSASDPEDGDLASQISWSSSRDGRIGSGASFQRALSVGTHAITASVTDSAGSSAESQISVTVESLVLAPSPGVFALEVRGYKVKGTQYADLTWSGASSASVDIYRDGVRLVTTANDGRHTDALNRKGNGAYTYTVCEAGTSTCSAQARATF